MSKLRDKRIACGFTQRELAQIASITERGYRQIESGEVSPNIKPAISIADALKVKTFAEFKELFS